MPEFSAKVTTVGGAVGFIRSQQGDMSYNHALLLNRDSSNQHIIASITGLQEALDSKADDDTTAAALQNISRALSSKADSASTAASIQSILNELADKTETGEFDQAIAGIMSELATRGTNLWFDTENNLLYMIDSEGNPTSDGVAVQAAGGGGGGGGSSASYVITLKAVGDRSISVATGGAVSLTFTYTSEDGDGDNDGAGIGSIQVGGATVRTFSAQQGTNTLVITDLLSNGKNNVKIKVENSEGSSRMLSYTIEIVSMSITTTMESIASYSGAVPFNYTLSGAGNKTMHYVLDGVEIGTEIVTSTGRSRAYTIPEQSHGSHLFRAYATATVNGVEITSNEVVISMVWVNPASTVPIIATPYNTTALTQGDSVIIPYMVYDPLYEEAEVTLSVIGESGATYSSKTITRGRDKTTEDPWSLQDYPAGETTFRISCRGVNYDIVIDVEEYIFPLDEVTDGLLLSFSADGRSNGETNPGSWTYDNGEDVISASFDGFGWDQADGWLQDADNVTVLRHLPGDTTTIQFKPFSTDKRETGYTIEVEFATRDVRDYESVVMSCMKGGRGFQIASQEAKLSSEQSSVSMLFKEDSRVRVTFVIEEINLNRLIFIFINGIMCGVTQYPANDNFQQPSPYEGITIGANTCGLDLYKIRCYGKGLNRGEVLDNYIFDRSTLSERQGAFLRNNILNENEEVTMAHLPTDLPYMLIACPELPQYKGDKKTCYIYFYDPTNSKKCFECYDATIDVQGTSSAVYPVKNFKIKFKGGTLLVNGQEATKYELRDGDIPVDTFCLKTDYASCEGANNVELVDTYEDTCKAHNYLIPPQEEDGRVRQGIAGRPIVVFWRNDVTNETKFVGKTVLLTLNSI